MRTIAAYCLLLVTTAISPDAAQSQAAETPKLGKPNEEFAAVHRMAFQIFEDLNKRSVQTNREFCGYLYLDGQGALVATRPVKGSTHGCSSGFPGDAREVIASYHTHAAYDFSSFNEYPSDIDLEGDFQNRLNGYIATPGGRLWFVDYKKRVARQLCGYRCLPFDRRYRENRENRPKTHVTLGFLRKVFRSNPVE